MRVRPTRVILIRHAHPDEDAAGRCCGSLDIGLSETGRAQAQTLAAALAPADVNAVFASPLRRAVETAEPVAGACGVPLQIDDDLRELDFGALEGRRFDEIAASLPDLYQRWMTHPTTVTFPGGESFADLSRRALAATERIRTELLGGTALVVTHGGVCRALVASALRIAPELIFRLDFDYGRITVIDWYAEPVLRLLNGRATDVPRRA